MTARIRDLDLLDQATRSGGARCPTCDGHVQVYRRTINADMARVLIFTYSFFLENPGEYLKLSDWLVKNKAFRSADYAKLVWWKLLEKAPQLPPPARSSTGLYRMTQKGRLFTENKLAVPSHAREYMSNVEEFYGDEINIRQALGRGFDYSELMSGQTNLFT